MRTPLLVATSCAVAARGGPLPPSFLIAGGAGARLPPRRIPIAYVLGPSSSARPSAVPALPNRFGHDRLCGDRPATAAFDDPRVDPGPRRHGVAPSILRARQELEEDASVVGTDEAVATLAKAPPEYIGDTAQAAVDGKEAEYYFSNAFADESASNIDSAIDKTASDRAIPEEFLPILGLCFLVTFLSALDRVAMSIAILPMSGEFQYTETVKGQISSAVSYGYGAAILPFGLAVSVASPRLLMLVGVFLWSLATLGTPWMAQLSGGGMEMFLPPLLSARAVMGAAEAVVLPTIQRVLANWVPPERKATALAIVISGFQMGTVGAYLVSPLILDAMGGLDGGPAGVPGWRGMFYVYGVAGLLWMVPWWLFAKDTPTSEQPGIIDEDCEEALVNNMMNDDASLVLTDECLVDSGDAARDATGASRIQEIGNLLRSAPWSGFVRSRGVWGMTLAHAAKNWELYNLLAWTPTFFSEQYGLNIKESAAFSILPSICGAVGGLTAGNLADYVLSRYVGDDTKACDKEMAVEKRTEVRKLFQAIALLGPAACLYLLSNLPERATAAQLLLGGTVGLQAFDAAGFGAATQEKAGSRWSGLLYSLTSLPGVVIGSVSVSTTGILLDMMADREGAGWTTVFQLNAAVCVSGALAFLFLYDSKKEFE